VVRKLSSRDYVGSNGFGATANVHSFSEVNDMLEVVLPHTDRSLRLSMDVEATVPASEARMVQDNLRVLVVCTVQPDKPVRTTERYSEATFHDPTEMMLTERHLRSMLRSCGYSTPVRVRSTPKRRTSSITRARLRTRFRYRVSRQLTETAGFTVNPSRDSITCNNGTVYDHSL